MSRIYHLSKTNLNGKILQPRVPSNFLVKNGYEDDKTKRVSFAKSIDGALRGLSQNLKGKKLYVHISDGNYKTYIPSIKEVPDSKITNEVWIKEPVKLKCIGRIEIIEDKGEPGIPYKYGNNSAELYDWKWKWVETIKESYIEEDEKINESFDIHTFYNELKTELESNQDGVFVITPSKDKEQLDDAFQKFNSQNEDQKKKADTRSMTLYGMNNYDHYHTLLSKIKKGTEDDELDGLEYNKDDKEVVKEDTNAYINMKELDEKIKQAIEFNKHTIERVIIYPTQDANELESLYLKYMALEIDDRAASDDKSREMFGQGNRELYQYIKDNFIKPTNDEIEGTHTVKPKEIEKEARKTSLVTNDLPLLTPKELSTKVEENYSCFNKEDGEIIKSWRESYALLGNGIKIPDYNKINLKRIDILRKSIYENNEEAIIQCGWIPELEFSSENRAKATRYTIDEIIKDRSKLADWVINTDETIEDIQSRSESLNESFIFSKNDLYYNFEKFEDGDSNILLITGLSGSGKSTLAEQLSNKYKAEYIEIDLFEDLFIFENTEELKKHVMVFYDYMTTHKNIWNKIKNKTLKREELWKVLYDFIKYCISWCKKHKDQKFIIEGIQIYEVFREEAIKYPLIIKGSSSLKSFIQKSIKREKWTYKEFLKETKGELSWLIRGDKELNKLRKSLNESYIEESKDNSTVDNNFKTKKSDKFEYIDLKNSKSWDYLSRDGGASIKKYIDIFKKTRVGQIVIDTDKDKLAGYCFIFKDGEYKGYLDSLTVKPQYRGYGISNKLVKDAISKYHANRLNVYKDNEVAIRLYKKHGFVIAGETGDGKKNTNMYFMTTNKSAIKESYIEEASSKEEKKAVSIILVSGKSLLGKAIKKVQGTQFSHASISLDDDISKIYSYNKNNGFDGLAYESVKQFMKEGVDRMGVYTFLVSKKVYNSIEKALDNFSLYINKTKYSILNLLTIPLNIPLEMDMKLVCSEFVDTLLKAAKIDLTEKKSSLVSPKDFINVTKTNTKIVEVFNDHPKKFKHKEIEKKIKKLKRSNFPIVEFTEYSDEVITEAKSFPIQFDSDGNLNLKNIRRINFEQEYANSHRLLMEYDRSNSYEPMKFELAKMQFFITLLEKKIYKKGKDKSAKELKVRARFLNDFKKYLKIVTSNDTSFNFTEYYEQSPFNDAIIQIDKNTLKFGWEALKHIMK